MIGKLKFQLHNIYLLFLFVDRFFISILDVSSLRLKQQEVHFFPSLWLLWWLLQQFQPIYCKLFQAVKNVDKLAKKVDDKFTAVLDYGRNEKYCSVCAPGEKYSLLQMNTQICLKYMQDAENPCTENSYDWSLDASHNGSPIWRTRLTASLTIWKQKFWAGELSEQIHGIRPIVIHTHRLWAKSGWNWLTDWPLLYWFTHGSLQI